MGVPRDYKTKQDCNFRISVRTRDKKICQWPQCGQKKVQVHHIFPYAKYPLLRYSIDHAICLCKTHHKLVTGKEEQYAAMFLQIIALKKKSLVTKEYDSKHKFHLSSTSPKPLKKPRISERKKPRCNRPLKDPE